MNNFLERDAKNSSKKNQHFMPSLRNAIKNYRLLTSKEIDILDKILQIMKNPYESNNNKKSKSNKFIKYKIPNTEICFFHKCQALYASLKGLMNESGYIPNKIKASIISKEEMFGDLESSPMTLHLSNADEVSSITFDMHNRNHHEYGFLSMKQSNQSNTLEATSIIVDDENKYEQESNEATSFGYITCNSHEYDNDDMYDYKGSNFINQERNQKGNDFQEFLTEEKIPNTDYLSFHSKSSQCDYYPKFPDFWSLPPKWQIYIKKLENLSKIDKH